MRAQTGQHCQAGVYTHPTGTCWGSWSQQLTFPSSSSDMSSTSQTFLDHVIHNSGACWRSFTSQAFSRVHCTPEPQGLVVLHLSATQVQAVPGQGFGRDFETSILESEIRASTLFQSQLLSKFKQHMTSASTLFIAQNIRRHCFIYIWSPLFLKRCHPIFFNIPTTVSSSFSLYCPSLHPLYPQPTICSSSVSVRKGQASCGYQQKSWHINFQ